MIGLGCADSCEIFNSQCQQHHLLADKSIGHFMVQRDAVGKYLCDFPSSFPESDDSKNLKL